MKPHTEHSEGNDAEDPRNVFLDAHAVMQRYNWGKSRGYMNLKDRDLMPPPVMTHPDRWRLDQLQRWEEFRMERAERKLAKLAELLPRERLSTMLPPPKRRRNQSA